MIEIDKDNKEMWKCMRCTYLNRSELVFCQLCESPIPEQFKLFQKSKGLDQNQYSKQKQYLQQKQDFDQILCLNCFQENNIENLSCVYCEQILCKDNEQSMIEQKPIQQQELINQNKKNEKQNGMQYQQKKICINCLQQKYQLKNQLCEVCSQNMIIQCPFCLIQVSLKNSDQHLQNCQKNMQILQKLKKQQQLPLGKFICIICEQIHTIDQVMILLDCSHRTCKNCIQKDINIKITNGEVNEINCKLCSQRVGYQTIKYLTDKSQFQKYLDLVHKNLKIQDPDLLFRPCKGFITNTLQPLPESINQEKLQSFCNFYRNQPKQKHPKIKPCQAIISYHKIQDKELSTYRCLICNLQMCINGCNSIHRGISCPQYNKQGLIFNTFVNYFGLTKQMLDERGNRDYVRADISAIRTINGERYFLPHGFKQYGINLKGKYQNNNWLEKGQNAWVVMYHGVKNAHLNVSMGNVIINPFIAPKKSKLNKIQMINQEKFGVNPGQQNTIFKNIIQVGLKAGAGQGYKGRQCIRTKKIIGVGIYGSPHVDVCSNGYSRFSTSVQGINYSVVIKCRVKPQAIRVCAKASDLGRKQAQYQNDYWVIENPQHVRPYAFLLKRQ